MGLVIMRLGEANYEGSEDIFRFLNALFYPGRKGAIEELSEYVELGRNEELLDEVKQMSGLGQSVYEEGLEEGIKKGIEKGIQIQTINIVWSLHQMEMSVPDIAKALKCSEEEVENTLRS